MGADGTTLVGPVDGNEAALLAYHMDDDGEAVSIIDKNDPKIRGFRAAGGKFETLRQCLEVRPSLKFWLDRMPTT
jgi:hypothetical protein